MKPRRPRRWGRVPLRGAAALLVAAAAACTTSFPERGERVACATDADCPGAERCAELTPGDLRCWPEEVACADRPCPEPGSGPVIIPIGEREHTDAEAGGAGGDEAPPGDAAPPVGGGTGEPPGPPTAPPAGDGCPQTELLTECPVDNEGFCVYEPSNRWLPVPCALLCEAAGLTCEGTSEDHGEVCDIDSYFPDCDAVGAALACVCSR